MAMILQPIPEPAIVVADPQPVIIQPMPEPAIVITEPPPVIFQSVNQPAVTVVQQAPGPVLIQPKLGDTPGRMKCNYCQNDIVTVTKAVNGLLTWTVAGVLFLFVMWPCCVIPFFVSSCKDIEHSCPNCHQVIYVHKRM